VTGLIDCLDVNFKGKTDVKGVYNPRMFRADIGNSLYELTGQPLPSNKQIWQRWWANEGQKLAWIPDHSH